MWYNGVESCRQNGATFDSREAIGMKPIKRDAYLQELISKKENGMIKVITGIRRCGKSYLLFELYRNYLLSTGVKEENIIALALDTLQNAPYRDPMKLSDYVTAKVADKSQMYYVFIDEIQYAIKKEELKSEEPLPLYGVLNGFLHLGNVDVYVTGSNSKLLSKDVMTEFRGRGDEVRVFPLTFKEYYDFVGGDKADAFEAYALYGGLPFTLSLPDARAKMKYLTDLFRETYFKDIEERYAIELPEVMKLLTDDLCSSVGSLVNASKLANTLQSVRKIKVTSETVSRYLDYLEESFLFCHANRYDVKGKRYFSYPSKYYCTDMGLRNARLNFRQDEETHAMENIIFNELIARGYAVDVGVVEVNEAGKKKQCEIDFVVNLGPERYYIQSAYRLGSEEKINAERRPLLATDDFFKKIIITNSRKPTSYDDKGIVYMGLFDFLLGSSFS